MTIDGFDKPITLKVRITCTRTHRVGFHRLVGVGQERHQLSAGLCQGLCLLCAEGRDCAGNSKQRRWLRSRSRRRKIPSSTRCTRPRSPCATSSAISVPDTMYDAFEQDRAGIGACRGCRVPVRNFQVSLRPRTDAPAPKDARWSEVLTFNSGGSGARHRA